MVSAIQTSSPTAVQAKVDRANPLPVLRKLLAQQQAVPHVSLFHSSHQHYPIRNASLLLPQLQHAQRHHAQPLLHDVEGVRAMPQLQLDHYISVGATLYHHQTPRARAVQRAAP